MFRIQQIKSPRLAIRKKPKAVVNKIFVLHMLVVVKPTPAVTTMHAR